MKIAFCFLTRGDLLQPRVWEDFFRAADPDKFSVYWHPKGSIDAASVVLRGRAIDKIVATRYGHVSLVEATLNLFSHAYADSEDNEYFVLLSESTIPIVSFEHISKCLPFFGSRSLAGYQVAPPNSEHYQRLRQVTQPELFASAFYYHDQWVVLNRRHVTMLLDRPSLALFDNVIAPDEHYFMNVLVHLKGVPVGQFVNRRTTFVNWHEREIKTYVNRATGQIVGRTVHPKTYRQLMAADLTQARNKGCWFFRKVDAECDCTSVMGQMSQTLAAV